MDGTMAELDILVSKFLGHDQESIIHGYTYYLEDAIKLMRPRWELSILADDEMEPGDERWWCYDGTTEKTITASTPALAICKTFVAWMQAGEVQS